MQGLINQLDNYSNSQTDYEPVSSINLNAPLSAVPIITSQSLLRGKNCVLIEHAGQYYQLRATKLGKLILTK